MRDPIVRMFTSASQAQNAVAALHAAQFAPGRVHLVTAPQATDNRSLDDITDSVMAGYVLRSRAIIYAQRIAEGRSLVVVHAPFGSAGLAIRTMEAFGPTESGWEPPAAPSRTWDEAAPLSSALALPVRMNRATPLSDMFYLPALRKSRPGFLGDLYPHTLTMSDILGLPILGAAAAPLSGLLGLKLLRKGAAPLSSTLGLKLLKSGAAPLSRALGLKVLSRNSAPLSSLFGLPTLCRAG
ncbi:MAG: hypothetical protein FJ164_04555 [Gammaproteobacteria bacterium]|nr:hypothetical protein [Gammaproteobacteria bacterium]